MASYKNVLLNANMKGIYSIWLRLKRRKAELKQQFKVSFPDMLAYFAMVLDAVSDIFSQL